MTQRHVMTLTVFVCVTIATRYSMLQPLTMAAPISEPQRVRAEEIGKSVEIIGRLGEPMTNVVEIEGHWVHRGLTKSSPFVFNVTSVNNRKLDTPIEFGRSVVTFDAQSLEDREVSLEETWTCKAIERGEFRYAIADNWELFFERPVASASWGDGPFVSDLVICKRTLQRRPKK